MMSSFHLHEQQNRTESKIVVALERISEAFRVMLWNESKSNALSPIQIQILIFLLYHNSEKGKVSYLAEEFNMTKATISDSVRVLLQKDLVQKVIDEKDSRSYSLVLSEKGKAIAQKSALFTAAFEGPMEALSGEQKEAMLLGLFQLIKNLNEAGIISVQRMCFNCKYYLSNAEGHYCQFLKSRLLDSELRIDCPEHEPKAGSV